MVALGFAALLLFALTATTASLCNRVLCSRMLRTLGKYSYGLYVFNQPIAFFPGNERFHDQLVSWITLPLAATVIHAIAGMTLTFGAAWISWHVLEKHFLKLKPRFAPKDGPVSQSARAARLTT
jgi:peptidoglycan/LPS O-acetylase OafA/YrhL